MDDSLQPDPCHTGLYAHDILSDLTSMEWRSLMVDTGFAAESTPPVAGSHPQTLPAGIDEHIHTSDADTALSPPINNLPGAPPLSNNILPGSIYQPQTRLNTRDSNKDGRIITRFLFGTAEQQGANVTSMKSLQAEFNNIPVPFDDILDYGSLETLQNTLLAKTYHCYQLKTNYVIGYAASVYDSRTSSYHRLPFANTSELWQGVVASISSIYGKHDSCLNALPCSLCNNPATIMVCFRPASPTLALTMPEFRNEIPMLYWDDYDEEYGLKLASYGATALQRYQSICPVGFQALQSPNLKPLPSLPEKPTIAPDSSEATMVYNFKGPSGRRMCTPMKEYSGPPPSSAYDKAVVIEKPTNNIKAENETCLTCVRHKKRCKGTKLVLFNNDYRCECCAKKNKDGYGTRTCYWKDAKAGINTYEDAQTKIGTRKSCNTRADIFKRTQERLALKEEDGQKE